MALAFAMIGLYFPMFPLYFRSIGLSPSQIAILMAVPGVSTLLANQIWGYLTDVQLNRRTVIALMCLVASVTAVLFPRFETFGALLIMMGVNSFFSDGRIPMVNAMVLANRKGEERFGPIRLCGSMAFVLSTILAGRLSDMEGGPGIRVIFPMLVVVNLSWAAMMYFVKDFPLGQGRKVAPDRRVSILQVQRILLRKPVVRSFLIFVLIFQLAHHISLIFQGLLIKDVGGSTTDVAIAYSIGAVAEMIIFIFSRKLLASVRLMPLLLAAALAQIIRWALVFTFPTVPVIFATNCLHMFTFGLMYLTAVVFMNREVPPEVRSSGQTILAIVYGSFGMILGPLLGSIIFQFLSIRWWYAFATIVACLALPLWYRVRTGYEREHNVSGFWVR
ncbi:MFS transporter [bacterium]|nr:MFS transporter [bacterium]